MTWVTPSVRATGDLITAAIWNTDLVNNLIILPHEVAETSLTTFTSVSATTEAGSTTFATLTFTSDGSLHLLEAQWYATRGTTWINFALFLDGVDQGIIENISAPQISGSFAYTWSLRTTPASGSRTYTLRGWVDAGTGTAGGGAGGAGVALNGYFRAVKAGA